MVDRLQPAAVNAHKREGPATLFLKGIDVGTVEVSGGDSSWGFGKFFPNDAFSSLAPIFGSWSVLMHAEDSQDRLSRDAALELAQAEAMLDSLKAQLFFIKDQELIEAFQITIDGDRLEWKEF